jgi:Ca2+/Na+ antiporter
LHGFFPVWLEVKRPVLLNRNVSWPCVFTMGINYKPSSTRTFSSTTMNIYIYIIIIIIFLLLLYYIIYIYVYYIYKKKQIANEKNLLKIFQTRSTQLRDPSKEKHHNNNSSKPKMHDLYHRPSPVVWPLSAPAWTTNPTMSRWPWLSANQHGLHCHGSPTENVPRD